MATTRMNTPSAEHARILVVDEDPAFQLGLKTFLREYVGFEKVFTAQSGAEAIDRILEDETIDVVTLDFQMPGMTGIEVLEALREKLDRPVSFLMITGYPSNELEKEFQSFHSETLLTTYFLSKPIEFEKLEPLVLQSHERVCAAKEIGLNEIPEETEPTSPVDPDPNLDSPHRELRKIRERLAVQGDRIEELENELAAQRGLWRSDLFKVLLVGGLLFAGWHFDWIEKAKPFGSRIVEDAKVYVSKWNEMRGETSSAPAEGEEEAQPPETSPPPRINEGRPL